MARFFASSRAAATYVYEYKYKLIRSEQISLTPEEQLSSSGADENFMFACWSRILFTFTVTCATVQLKKHSYGEIPHAKLIPLKKKKKRVLVVSGCIRAAWQFWFRESIFGILWKQTAAGLDTQSFDFWWKIIVNKAAVRVQFKQNIWYNYLEIIKKYLVCYLISYKWVVGSFKVELLLLTYNLNAYLCMPIEPVIRSIINTFKHILIKLAKPTSPNAKKHFAKFVQP